jgi:hypothetical protein
MEATPVVIAIIPRPELSGRLSDRLRGQVIAETIAREIVLAHNTDE